MFHKFGRAIFPAVAAMLTLTNHGFTAQNRPPSIFVPPPLSAVLKNKTVIFSWPVAKLEWELVEQKSADLGDCKAVALNLYRTNNGIVSVTLPIIEKPVFYKIKRSSIVRIAPAIAGQPPLPTEATNRPRARVTQ